MPHDALMQAGSDVDFVEAAYATLLGRAADPHGLRHYLERLRSEASRQAVIEELLASPEAQAHRRHAGPDQADVPPEQLTVATLLKTRDDFEFVKRACFELTGQAPTTGEAIAWLAGLGRGWSRLRLLHQLRRSAAGRAHQARLPDVHLLDLTNTQLAEAGQCTLAQLLSVSDEAFVQLAYMRLFRREADPAGRSCYLALCRSGTPRQEILRLLLASEEGRALGAQLDGLDGTVAQPEPRHGEPALAGLQRSA